MTLLDWYNVLVASATSETNLKVSIEQLSLSSARHVPCGGTKPERYAALASSWLTWFLRFLLCCSNTFHLDSEPDKSLKLVWISKYRFERNSTASFITFTVKGKVPTLCFLNNIIARDNTAFFDLSRHSHILELGVELCEHQFDSGSTVSFPVLTQL